MRHQRSRVFGFNGALGPPRRHLRPVQDGALPVHLFSEQLGVPYRRFRMWKRLMLSFELLHDDKTT